MRRALSLALIMAGGCGGGPAPAPPPLPGPPPPPTLRLWPALGPPAYVRLRDETRPAILLRPREERSCSVDARPDRRLSFVWTLAPSSPAQGFVELQVSAGAETIYRSAFSLSRRHRWWPVSVPLSSHGPVKLTFRGDHLHAQGRPMKRDEKSSVPWIVVASPRIEGPPAAPGRVLLWISQDAVRADHLGAYGYARPTSPHFDRQAAQWVVFENAVSTASWTLPSLASHFTSRYPLFHGALGQSRPRDDRTPTVFEVLGRAGFTVLGITANDFVSSYFGMAHGFDVLRFTGGAEGPEGRQRAEDLNRLALEALGQWRGGDLALFVHYMDAHYPYDPPAPFDRLFSADNSEAGGGGLERAKAEARYDGEIAYTDAQIDRLLKELDGRGLLRDAVIVYTADHGEEFLDHGAWRHSRTLYREMLHVPLALHLPGIGGRRVADTVSLVDLAPTILDALGVPAPASFQGRSLMPLARGERLPAREVFAETERKSEDVHRLAVQLGSVKYILRTRNADPAERLSEELYDLAADPRERTSVLSHPETARLRRYAAEYLRRGRAEARAPGTVDAPPELRARLRALGYVQ